MRRRLTLPDVASNPSVTDINRPLIPPSFNAAADGYVNRNATSTLPIQLVANTSLRILPRNPRRSGMQIQNLDPTTDLNYSLGNDLQGSGLLVVPRGTVLYDFTTPCDELYLFSTANISVVILEITRTAAPTTFVRK